MCGRFIFALTSLALVTYLCSPTESWGQFKMGGGGGSMGFMFRDPGSSFNFMAKGRNFFLISETRGLRDPLTQFAQERGITNGQINREQFMVFSEMMKAKYGMGSGGPGGGPGGFKPFPPPSSGASQPMGTTSPVAAPAGPNPADALNQFAESEFKRRDKNGDGFLNMDEMSDGLKAELGRWDASRDNLINMEEYKAYFVARFQAGRRGGDNDGPAADPVAIIIEEEELDRRPTVFRAGKLPKELPAWFQELDADKDGQVSLYEWRKGSKKFDEFPGWDRNNDGFLTAEETLFKQRQTQTASAQIDAAGPAANRPPTPADDGKKGRFNGFKFQFKRPQ